MRKFESVDDLLDFAISEEEAAAAFYTGLAAKVTGSGMSDIFLAYAKEELGHKAKLLKVKAGQIAHLPKEKVLDLKIAEYLVEGTLDPDMDYQQALILAMKKEKAAYKMYTDLAGVADDAALRDVLLGLAQEEAKHKLRFEIEYDDKILTEN